MEAKKVKSLMEAYASVYENQQLDEFLGAGVQKAVDKGTKAIQSGLERMGVKINRTERGTTTKQQQQDKIKKNVQDDVDLFDIVKGHLIDEGYADTEEAALAIMANMSEEWRQSIVEKFPDVKGTLNPWESPQTGKSGVKYVTDPKTGKPVQIRNPLYKGV